MTEQEIRQLRVKSLVDSVKHCIDDNREFTVVFPPNYENCCKILVGPNEFIMTVDEIKKLVNSL